MKHTCKSIASIIAITLLFSLFSRCTNSDEANLVKSYVYEETVYAWDFNSNTDEWYHSVAVDGLTTNNIDQAAVLVYFKVATAWRALPYTEVASTNYFMNYYSFAGRVEVIWEYNGVFGSGDSPNVYYGTNVKLKIVVLSNSQRRANPDLDWSDYEAVKQRFNLQEKPAQLLH
ncbi:MAG: hypothetical protein IM638_01870 [Bacteroidetes bacterium]|nr:hypothetical protein [Bacteroidota bacterium]